MICVEVCETRVVMGSGIVKPNQRRSNPISAAILSGSLVLFVIPTGVLGLCIDLDDPRPGIVRFNSDVGVNLFVGDRFVGQHTARPQVKSRTGNIRASASEVVLSDWQFQMGEASSTEVITAENVDFRVALSVDMWGGTQQRQISSPLIPTESPILWRVSTPPMIADFTFDHITVTWHVSGPTEMASGRFDLILDDGDVLGGQFVSNHELLFYDIGFLSSQPTLYQGTLDSVPLIISGIGGLAIIVAPEPRNCILEFLVLCSAYGLAKQWRRGNSRV
jgi:hypothetical protein